MNEWLWHLISTLIALASLLFAAATILIACIAHFLRGRKRSRATSIMLASGTLSIISTYLIMFLPVVGSEKVLHTDQGYGTVNKLNLIGLNMQVHEATVAFHPVLREYLRVVDDLKETREDELKTSSEELWRYLKDKQRKSTSTTFQSDLRLSLAALDVVEHERKQPSLKIEEYLKENKIENTKWHILIEKVYGDKALSPDEKKILFSSAIMPSVWFADQLQLRIARSFGPTPESTVVQNRVLALNEKYTSQVLLDTLLTTAFIITGIVVLFIYYKGPKAAFVEKWPAVPWGWNGAWGAIIWTFYLQIPVFLLLGSRSGFGFGDGIARKLSNDLLSECLMLVLVVWMIKLVVFGSSKTRLAAGLHLTSISVNEWKKVALHVFYFFTVGTFLSYLSNFAFRFLTGDNINAYNPIRGEIMTAIATHDPLLMLCTFALTSVIGPIFEEILFRGVLFAWLRTRMNFFAASLISATVFGFAHGDMGAVFLYIGMGILFAFIFEKCKTLYAPIALHMLWNANSFVSKLLWYYY